MISELVHDAASRWGDTTAVVSPQGWAVSYDRLDALATEVTAGLAGLGIGDGDVVALALPSSPAHHVLWAALARLGAISAGVNSRLTASERTVVLDRAGSAMVITTDDLASGRPEEVVVSVDAEDSFLLPLRRKDAPPPPPSFDLDRPVAIVFTSGTTGSPRGAVFCGRQLAAITAIDTAGRWGGGGRSLGATPLAHLGPTTKFWGTLMRGGTTHLVQRWSPGTALALTSEHDMTAIAGIPTQLALMLAHPDFERTDLTSVIGILIGGGPATPELIREARRRIGAPVATRYACTEAGIGLGTAFDADPIDAEVSVGRPQPGVAMSVRGPGGAPLPNGEVGEVGLRSDAVMSCYWNDPVATRAAFWPDGFVRTGDLGMIDPAGRLRLMGRSTEMYVRGGYNIHPLEVEAALSRHPAVTQVAVVGIPDDIMGEIGVAVIVVTPGQPAPSLDELRSASQDLGSHKRPDRLVITQTLPLTAMDKVDRRALTAMIGASGLQAGETDG